jgi:hypothetical protein
MMRRFADIDATGSRPGAHELSLEDGPEPWLSGDLGDPAGQSLGLRAGVPRGRPYRCHRRLRRGSRRAARREPRPSIRNTLVTRPTHGAGAKRQSSDIAATHALGRTSQSAALAAPSDYEALRKTGKPVAMPVRNGQVKRTRDLWAISGCARKQLVRSRQRLVALAFSVLQNSDHG